MKTSWWSRAALAGAACLMVPGGAVFAQNDAIQLSPEQAAYQREMDALSKGLKRQTGDISIAPAHATLRLGDDYYFIGPDDSRKVIVDAWGNPPDSADGVLGMVFPAGTDFRDETGWGAVITFEQEGHVSDDDAASADFDALLSDMREGEEDSNRAREEAGYPPRHLLGWAARPAYDRASHSVVWAREIAFGSEQDHALNYDVRLLGRSGVLSLNVVSTMSQLNSVKTAADNFAKTASFNDGFAYADYVEGVDKAAGYGIGGLVAAGVGVAAAKKLGLLAVALGFGKKFFLLFIAAAAGIWKWLRSRLGGRVEDGFDDEGQSEPQAVSTDQAVTDSAGVTDPPQT